MSATRLLVLGLVKAFGRTHGYVISKQLLGWRVDVWANTKTGSIYHALRTLTKEGHLLALDVASSDFGPPRTEYEITQSGCDEFFALMRRAISVPETRPDALCASLVFLTSLTREEAIALFMKRVDYFVDTQETIKRDLDAAVGMDPSLLPPHLDSMTNFWVDWAISGCAWSRSMVRTLEDGAYSFVGEPNAVAWRPPMTTGLNA
jgi:DNA-binding PadR family transcriptional regulator